MEKEKKKSYVHKVNVGFPLNGEKTRKKEREKDTRTETSPTQKTDGSI